MIASIKSYANNFLHLLYPHYCIGCGTDVINDADSLCIKCVSDLPETNFFELPNNPVEKTFYGRIQLEAAASAFYFTKDSLLQQLMIELKYKSNKDVGFFLGKLIAQQIKISSRFNEIDILVPLPLNPKKEQKRGYNQAKIICDGMASMLQKPIVDKAVIRTHFTETQTKQNRVHRWQNMENVFEIADATSIEGKHILLIDDVVTTGATLEACGKSILSIPNTKLSIATIAYTI
jgi:ComF family protein